MKNCIKNIGFGDEFALHIMINSSSGGGGGVTVLLKIEGRFLPLN